MFRNLSERPTLVLAVVCGYMLCAGLVVLRDVHEASVEARIPPGEKGPALNLGAQTDHDRLSPADRRWTRFTTCHHDGHDYVTVVMQVGGHPALQVLHAPGCACHAAEK